MMTFPILAVILLGLFGIALRSGSELTDELLAMTAQQLEAAALRESQDGHYPNLYSREIARRAV